MSVIPCNHLWQVESGVALDEPRAEERSVRCGSSLLTKNTFTDFFRAFCHVGYYAPSKHSHPTVIRLPLSSLIDDDSSKVDT
jgi:hypothetical protein